MIRSSRPRLSDIDENVALVLAQVRGRTQDDFERDIVFRYMLLHALMIIAEAVRNLPPDLTARYPDIPWSKIVGIGTKIKHEYHRVDSLVVWTAVTVHLLPLQTVVAQMIADEDLVAEGL